MTGLHDPLPPAHYVTDQPAPAQGFIHTYVAMCSCGWRNRDERTERDAEYELRIHQENTKETSQ